MPDKNMDLFKKFLQDLGKYSKGGITINEIRSSISRMNQFLYQTYADLGTTTEALEGEEFQYFSEFHRFWEQYHKEILNPQIDENQCALVADVLHDIFIKFKAKPFYELYNTYSLKTDIILISSFLDIFCYQYGLIDRMNALAWRKVWEIWSHKYPKECIESPCLIDYIVYRVIGKDFCKESLCIFECETKKHTFKWHSGRNKTCQICYKSKIKNKAYIIDKILPCADSEGYIVIEQSIFVSGNNPLLPGIKECPFEVVCQPKCKLFRKLNPPKSISILGQTGWESARTEIDEGGGGLMS